MNKIQLEIVGLSYSQTQTGAYALVLGETVGKRRLPVIIGNFEAQAIAIELEKMKPSRPLTHDVFKDFALSFSIKIEEVIIYNLIEGIFYAKLICSNGFEKKEIDARTSDAIALAVRFGCPIYTYEFILSNAGIVLDEDIDTQETESAEKAPADIQISKKSANKSLMQLSDEQLQEELQKALESEDYEKASEIRDELKSRS